MKTFKQWVDSCKNWHKFCPNKSEVDKEIYNYFLEVTPPKNWKNGTFQVSDIVRYNSESIPMLMSFKKTQGRYFYLGVLPDKSFTEKKEFTFQCQKPNEEAVIINAGFHWNIGEAKRFIFDKFGYTWLQSQKI